MSCPGRSKRSREHGIVPISLVCLYRPLLPGGAGPRGSLTDNVVPGGSDLVHVHVRAGVALAVHQRLVHPNAFLLQGRHMGLKGAARA